MCSVGGLTVLSLDQRMKFKFYVLAMKASDSRSAAIDPTQYSVPVGLPAVMCTLVMK